MPTLRSNGSLGMRWGVAGITISGTTGFIQKASSESSGEEYQVKNAAGETAIWYGFDRKDTLDFEVIVTGASANTSASVVRPMFGDIITVTDSITNNSASVIGTFVCQSSKVEYSNTEAAKISGKGSQWALITS